MKQGAGVCRWDGRAETFERRVAAVEVHALSLCGLCWVHRSGFSLVLAQNTDERMEERNI